MKNRVLHYLILLLVLSACILLCLQGKAQSMPLVLNPDPAFWHAKYEQQKARADSLAYWGTKAIMGLEAHLQAANDTITKQNKVIATVVDDRNTATDRAVKAENTVAKLEADRPKTWAGRVWKDFKTGLKIALPAYGVGFIVGRFR
ncbi:MULTISPECIES: hypothetical protein [unclassified Spirosoma]|uniref:hypothetical protein n=1 Tax=unclassified Spirosoma TaxID=2621999 RepID=UPI0009661EDD|nr:MULTISPECIES: hypothetical protein [unclassified Spirosoma]MBN8825085.1 hypothetical protein [Spirosoma sp.]OJW77221.1 MAG: hypothetical protein BGO59_31710 [Spirosoma sp. 48-14]